MPRYSKVLLRQEVRLYTIINFFGEVGGYLGLLLGESLLSYIMIGSNWIQVMFRKIRRTPVTDAVSQVSIRNQ